MIALLLRYTIGVLVMHINKYGGEGANLIVGTVFDSYLF
jgi:hypothetical protein